MIKKSFIALSALVFTTLAFADCCSSSSSDCCSSSSDACSATPLIVPRGTHVDAARDLVGIQRFFYHQPTDDFNGFWDITVQGGRTFKADELARCLFGSDLTSSSSSSSSCSSSSSDDCNAGTLTISGSTVADRGANDWLADYFGLPDNFQSTVTFYPQISNIVANFDAFFGLDEWVNGMYIRINLPVTHTRFALNFNETVIAKGTNHEHLLGTVGTDPNLAAYEIGYMSVDYVLREQLLTNATNFFDGSSAPMLRGRNEDDCTTNRATLYDTNFQALDAAKWCPCKGLSDTLLAAVNVDWGWNYLREDYHFGLYARASAPTGSRPTGEYLFEPIIGNGGHWELGGGISGHYDFWRNDAGDAFSVYADGYVTHLFKAKQTRVFDLVGKPNSRYMLAEKMSNYFPATFYCNPTRSASLCSQTTPTLCSDFQFAGEFAPVANLTSTRVNVSVAAQGDLAIKFSYYNHRGFSADLGYNVWGRTCEKICRITECNPTQLDGQHWALKGDAYVFGYALGGTGQFNYEPLSATESGATIHTGTNALATAVLHIAANPNIDNPQQGHSNWFGTALDTWWNSTPVNTSIQPILLSTSDVDYSGTKAVSNRVFAHISYDWDRDTCTPFLGIGGAAEFGGCGNCNDTTIANANCCSSDDSCKRCAVSQWSFWVKGGVAY